MSSPILRTIGPLVRGWWRLQGRRVPVRLQSTATGCGAACLCMILEFYRIDVAPKDVKRALGASSDGVNARKLLAVAESFGMSGRGLEVSTEQLRLLLPGSILHRNGQHFVVFEGTFFGLVLFVDPASGREVESATQFAEQYSGIALELKKRNAE